jgi:hypothetical protein
MVRGVPAILVAAALAAGCSNGRAAPASSALPATAATPSAPTARAVALRYFRRALAHRPTRRLTAPGTPAERRSLRRLEQWLASIPAHDVHGAAVPLPSRSPATASVLVTMRGRLGRGPGNAIVGFGGRRLLLRRGGGGWRVVADESWRPGSGVARDGLSAVPNARYVTGPNALVVNAAGASETDMTRAELGAAEFPRLLSRYARSGFDRTPVIFLLRDWRQAEGIAGVSFPHEVVGAEYRGLVFLDVPIWSRADEIGARGVVVHELTHLTSAGLVRGTPLSLVEGLARYEEDEYDRRMGAPRSTSPLAAAYRDGYPTVTRWGWAISNRWQLTSSLPIQLAYDDGAAVTRAVLTRDGLTGLRRLAAGFRREGGGWFSPVRLRTIFRRALGERLADVVARAHAETYAREAGAG